MPIHTVDKDSSAELGADIYAAELPCGSLPKRRMPESGVPGAVAYALVRDELILDGNARQNLATFCDKSKSTIPSFGYPVPYALSTVVFLIDGYIAMLLS